MSVTELLSFSSLALTVVMAVVGATWGISKVKDTARKEVDAHKKATDDHLENLRHDFEESFRGMRQKITDVELFGRDNFVQIPRFVEAIKGINDSLQIAFDRLDTRMDRMETKLDQSRRIG